MDMLIFIIILSTNEHFLEKIESDGNQRLSAKF